MADFMKDDFRAIFDNPHGTRRAIIARGRKNAKTFETAALMLLFLCGPECKPNSQLFSAARSRDQASVLFGLASKMVRMDPVLSGALVIRDAAKEIYFPEIGSKYKALSAEASTALGLSPRFLAHDELGQVRGPRDPLYEALETATAAQEDPLSIIISTQAPTDADLLSLLIDSAAQGEDPRTVLRLNTAPEELDPFSEEAIRAANPAFDHFMNKTEVLAMAADAKRMPSRQASYENLVLNRRVEASSPFINRELWQACGGEVADLKGVPVYAGLDLASVRDLTAFVMIGNVGGVWHVKPTFWLPSEGLADKARADKVPYDLWLEQGHLLTTPGNSVEYEYIAEYLRGAFDEYDIRKVGFDRWGMRHLRPWLLKAGFDEAFIDARFEDFGQGTRSMTPALRDLEVAISNRKLAHGNHPVLSWNARNAVVNGKDDKARTLAKLNDISRIDGMVALADAFGVAPAQSAEPAGAIDDFFASLAGE